MLIEGHMEDLHTLDASALVSEYSDQTIQRSILRAGGYLPWQILRHVLPIL